ncbi:MAG: hypothetical protein DWQ01_18780 [Planctomycetota bacterium]|nr:MAG: hypothetical protein DWQ01_18780 [Planctomycetota bacterium]
MTPRLPAASLLLASASLACGSLRTPDYSDHDFAAQATFLKEAADGILLESGTGAIVVSPTLQGRVMTSTLHRGGVGLGFVNRAVVQNPPAESAFFNYGGEDRFWLGPEGGPYSLYFQPGDPFDRDLWQVPEALNEGAWQVVSQDPTSVRMSQSMSLQNRVGSTYEVDVDRSVEVLSKTEASALLGGLPEGCQWVAFRSRNSIRNAGSRAWFPETGLLCIWILGMFQAGPDTWVVAPYREEGVDPSIPPVETAYFNPLDDQRLKRGNGFVLFKADAQYTSKIGVMRRRAVDVMAAYDPHRRVFTVVKFGPLRPEQPYLLELWDPETKRAYDGDVANSYNHGGPESFYELESSSPALALEPGEVYEHQHTTLHIRVPEGTDLGDVASRVLGIPWKEVRGLGGF